MKYLIVGPAGSGKTTSSIKLAIDMRHPGQRVAFLKGSGLRKSSLTVILDKAENQAEDELVRSEMFLVSGRHSIVIIEEKLREIKPSIILVDGVESIIDANSNEEVMNFFRMLDFHECSVILTMEAMFNRDGAKSSFEIRGSNALMTWPDTIFWTMKAR